MVYVLSSTVIMGIVPNEELQTSHAPFAEAARIAIGAAGRDRHQRVRGAQVGRIARRLDAAGRAVGARPRPTTACFRASSRASTATACPASGSIIVGGAHDDRAVRDRCRRRSPVSSTSIVDLAVILIIVPYVYSAVAVVKVIYDQQLPRSDVPDLQVDRARRGGLLPVGGRRRRSRRPSCTRMVALLDQRAAVSVLHPLDGGGRETPLASVTR